MIKGAFMKQLMLEEVIALLESLEAAALEGNIEEVKNQLVTAKKAYEEELKLEKRVLVNLFNLPIC